MGGAERLPLAQARRLGEQVRELLAPACERITLAGSIRRQAPDCGDIEIVAIPTIVPTWGEPDLFGLRSPGPSLNKLDRLCDRLLADGTFTYRLNKDGQRAWGTSLKWGVYSGFALDVYSADVDTWGVTLAIRTGPAGFSKRLVTPRSQQGWCPSHLHFEGWRLRQRATGDALPTPTEEEVFAALGLPYLPPELRSEQWAPRLEVVERA